MFTRIAYILLLMLSIPFSAIAQMGTFYTSNQKLSGCYVKHIYQDRLGFIWVSTQDGLNRYDGYTFLTFGTEDGLECDNINCTFEDKDQNLYAGTTSGIYVKVNGKFHIAKIKESGEEFHAFINDIVAAPDGSVLVSTSGRGIWRISNIDEAENIIAGEGVAQYITDMFFDKYGTLWGVSDSKGVISYKNFGSKDKPKYKSTGFYNVKNDFSHAIICDDKYGNVYAGSITGGVYRLVRGQKQFTLFASTAEIPVTSLLMRRDGMLFVGTNGYGLKVLNPKTGEIHDSYIACPQLNMSKTKVYSIFEDRYHNVWLGLFQKGVYMQPPHSDVFNCLGEKQGSANVIGENCIQSVFRQKNGTLWVSGDQDGLYGLDKNYKQIHHFVSNTPGKGVPSTTLCMEEDIDGKLWIGSYTEGCGWIDTSNGTYHRMPFSYGNSQSIFDIRRDDKGNLWMGTLGDGLKCYNVKTGALKEYKCDDPEHKLGNGYIVQMAMEKDFKKLFIGTAAGLCCLDLTNGSWTNTLGTNVVLGGDAISTILHDNKHALWIGTGKGLYSFDLKTKKITKQYTTADGLPDNHICSIEMASNGELWVSTNNGMFRFNPATGRIDKYYGSDGLQGNEYCAGVSFFDRTNSVMFFGGISGISYINPANIKASDRKIEVILTGLQMSGVRVKSFMKSGSYDICNEAISLANRFDFCHDDNTITLNFSTLTYSSIDHITFAYSINGDDWITLPAGQNNITLSRMSPGDYKFRVVAIDNGVRSAEKEFTLVIHNPWYFTPFARLIYALIIALGIWWYIKEQRKRNHEQLCLQEHIHREELNEQKLRFFINMSHEIRTPMTLILTPLLQLMKDDTESHRHATYEIIKRNAERILHIVNQILDLRKIDKGQMVMQMRETDLVSFTKEVVELFRVQATSKRIDMKFTHNTEPIPVWIDKNQFDKVLMNLLSNAFKYTPTGGKIRVSLDKGVDNIKLKVYDNGEKIPEESLQRIFERFYQTPSSSNQNKVGTGVGLDLTKALVHLHHGSISARNTEDGVEFIVTIPLGKEHLRPDEIAPELEESKREEEEALALTIQPKEGEEEEILLADPEPVNQSKRATVVVVEDDDEIRNYLVGELSTTYRVLDFPDGSDALPVILREIPQIILSDVMMPKMDGNTLCARVKANVNTNHIPFIMLTAKTRDEDKLEGLETGADLYVTKPFNMDILRRCIANLINSRHMLQNKFTGKEEMKEHIDEVQMESVDERLLNRIMTVINSNLNNSDLNIDMICTEVGISRVHLHRKMKELTNQTPHDFIRNLRLKQAARLLSRGGQSITEVMYKCGFNSATSFSTMFKKMYGLSPREFMKQQEESNDD